MNRLLAISLVVFSRLVSTAVAVALIVGFAQAGEPRDLVPLKDQSTDELIERLESAPRADWDCIDDVMPYFDAVLQELIKRGNLLVEQALEAKLRRTAEDPEPARKLLESMKRDDKDWQKQVAVVCNSKHNLERLTALRRVQHQVDPLQICVSVSPTGNTGTRILPVLKVALN